MDQHFTLLRVPISEIFNNIKDQPWVKRSGSIRYDPSLPKAEEYYSYNCKGHRIIHCWAIQKYL